MADVFDAEKRSDVMRRIKSSGNKATELALAQLLKQGRITGWRRNRKVYGKPDFVFPRHRIAVFVDGCFWHACPLHGRVPVSNRAFWMEKLDKNRRRDRLVTRRLRNNGWMVIRIWQHDLRGKHAAKVLARIRRALTLRSAVSETA